MNVPGAVVLLDGLEKALAPIEHEMFVEPGTRTIEAKRVGYADAKQVVEAAKGSAQVVTLTLVASAAVVPSTAATSSASGAPVTTPHAKRSRSRSRQTYRERTTRPPEEQQDDRSAATTASQ